MMRAKERENPGADRPGSSTLKIRVHGFKGRYGPGSVRIVLPRTSFEFVLNPNHPFPDFVYNEFLIQSSKFTVLNFVV